MPVILSEDKIDEWINPESDPESLIPYALTNMIAEKAGCPSRKHPVDAAGTGQEEISPKRESVSQIKK